VNTYAKLAAAAAAVLIVAFVGSQLMNGPSIGGPGANPTLTPSATSNPAATPAPSQSTVACEDELPGCAGSLAGGQHRSANLVPPLVYQTTGGSWSNVIDLPDLYKIDSTSDPTPGEQSILVWTNASISDQTSPCHVGPDPSLGRAEADWIDFVTTHPGIVATEPVDVFLNGVTARQVELSVDADWAQTCPGHAGPYVMLLTQQVAGQTAEYGLPANLRLLLTVLDVGDRTAVMLAYGPKEAADFDQAMEPIRAIIASFRMCGVSVGYGPCGGSGETRPAST